MPVPRSAVDDLLAALVAEPTAEDTWYVLADCLEETGEIERAELTRLQIQLRHEKRLQARVKPERRVRQLLASGVMPCVPTIENSLGMVFALIPAGFFWMGSPAGPATQEDERPRRLVQITQPFFLGVHQVTQAQYTKVMRRNPSAFGPNGIYAARVANQDTSRWPVENVSYRRHITRFLDRLSQRRDELAAKRCYRLPSEAEWEYACRGCICHAAYTFGHTLRHTDARFDRENDCPMPVGSYRPNLFGLYDTHGNVWEWTSDWYSSDYYKDAPAQDPHGPPIGFRRVLRGGGWSTPPHLCRSALRGHNTVNACHDYNGFRIAFSKNYSES
jgi:uncharacterized protein (TIGR02996 family)